MPLSNPIGEQVEQITYAPDVQTSGDMEAATSTISATSEPGAADYSDELTLAAPSDSRLVVLRIGIRLQVTVDSWGGGGTTLNYRIKRGGASIVTGTLTAASATGALYAVTDVTTGTLTGAATYDVYLWVDAGSCVISLAQLWAGVGMTDGATSGETCLRLDYYGAVKVSHYVIRIGSGTFAGGYWSGTGSTLSEKLLLVGSGSSSSWPSSTYAPFLFVPGTAYLRITDQTVATDLVYVHSIGLVLKG